MEPKEEWRDIRGYEELYQVSSLGRVRSLDKTIITQSCTGRELSRRVASGIVLKETIDKWGYSFMRLYNDASVPKMGRPHRLVAEAFIPNPENKGDVNHINGIKTDNRVENLEWMTRSENIKHAYSSGLAKPHTLKGDRNASSKLTNEQAKEIRLSKDKTRVLSERYSVSYDVIRNARSGKTYK